jgi:hypothetical protein
MNIIEPERYETRRAMLLAGLRSQNSFAKAAGAIPTRSLQAVCPKYQTQPC